MAAARPDVAATDGHRQEQGGVVLDAHPLQSIVAVRQPDPLCAFQDAEVDAPATGGAAFDLDLRKVGTQTVDQGITAARLICVGHRQDAVVVPFDVVDVVLRQDRGHAVVDEVADLGQGHVQGLLLAAQGLILGPERPVGMGAVDVAVRVDHLGLEPDAEGHALGLHMVDQRTEAIGIFARVDCPVRQAAGVVVAVAEPAVVEDEAFRAQFGGAGGNVLQIGSLWSK